MRLLVVTAQLLVVLVVLSVPKATYSQENYHHGEANRVPDASS